MRLRIRSDGTPRGTRVETEDGEMVHGVQRVAFEVSMDQPVALVTLTLRAKHVLDADAPVRVRYRLGSAE